MEMKKLKPWEGLSDYGLVLLNRIETDCKTVAERQWQGRMIAPKPQQPCDHGLFSDDALQLDLVEMLQEPAND
jgi:hypothetical protein